MMDINNKAKKYLAEHPKVPQVFATTDGFLFLRKDNAKAHANTLTDKKVIKFEQSKKQEEQPFDVLHGNIKEVSERLKGVTNTELLEALREQEQSEANRKIVLTLLEKKIEQLNKVED